MSADTPHRPRPLARDHYRAFRTITTRWMDNDVYGHLNNVVYYSLFDTAVNRLLIEAGALDLHAGEVIGLVVETHCNFFESLAFPQAIEAGVRVAHQGRSSVRYEIGLFAQGEARCYQWSKSWRLSTGHRCNAPLSILPGCRTRKHNS